MSFIRRVRNEEPPLEVYRYRAANYTPIEARPPRAMAVRMAYLKARSAVTGVTFYADWSYYQRVVTPVYGSPIACFRLDSGWMTDSNAAANLQVMLRSPKNKLIIGYVVQIPGQEENIVARVKQLLGAKCPAKVVFRVDLETGSGFAGPGEHSFGSNKLANLLAAYRRTAVNGMSLDRARQGVDGYANQYDWDNAWRTPPSWLKKAKARYSSTPPSQPWYSWQYAGGDARWGSPYGYPRAMSPFGSVLDMNVIPKPIDQILLEYGVTVPVPPKPKPPVPPVPPVPDHPPIPNGDQQVTKAQVLGMIIAFGRAILLGTENTDLGLTHKGYPNMIYSGGLLGRLNKIEKKVGI